MQTTSMFVALPRRFASSAARWRGLRTSMFYQGERGNKEGGWVVGAVVSCGWARGRRGLERMGAEAPVAYHVNVHAARSRHDFIPHDVARHGPREAQPHNAVEELVGAREVARVHVLIRPAPVPPRPPRRVRQGVGKVDDGGRVALLDGARRLSADPNLVDDVGVAWRVAERIAAAGVEPWARHQEEDGEEGLPHVWVDRRVARRPPCIRDLREP